MKAITKTFIAAGAVAVAGVAGGAYYASNHVMPERLAEDMNAAFSDAYGQKEFGTGLTVSKTGDITVEPTGLFTYKVMMPGLTVEGGSEEEGIILKSIMEPSEHILKTNDMAAAALSLIDPERPVSATIESVAPVTIETDVTVYDYFSEVRFDSDITCETLTYDIVLQNGQYDIKTLTDSCETNTLIKENDEKIGEITSGLAFSTDLSNLLEGNYSGSSAITLSDVEAKLYDNFDGALMAVITADSFSLGGDFDGLTAEARAKDPADLEYSDMPDGFSFRAAAENLTVDAQMLPPEMPKLSFVVDFNLSDLQSNAAIASFEVGYDIEGLENLGRMLPLQTAESSHCKFDLGNIPAMAIGEDIAGDIQEGGSFGFSGPDIIDGTIDEIESSDGVTLALDCEASSDERYSSEFDANHTLKGEAFPGSGRLELRGYEEAMNDMAMIVGPQIFELTEMFTAFAVPTEDGEGLVWQYELDETGNLTVNGQPFGPVLAP